LARHSAEGRPCTSTPIITFAGYAFRDLPPQIQRRARAKLLAIDAAKQLDDLRVPPGNRLEALHGDREGQNGIRINDQWRICFVWCAAKPGMLGSSTIIEERRHEH
jgi:proteic killer suppression protein